MDKVHNPSDSELPDKLLITYRQVETTYAVQ
jgi:hypothetical protein